MKPKHIDPLQLNVQIQEPTLEIPLPVHRSGSPRRSEAPLVHLEQSASFYETKINFISHEGGISQARVFALQMVIQVSQ